MISPNILIGLKLLMAVACGGAIGFERELSRKPAGLRTSVLICVGAALFMIVSRHIGGGAPYTDPARLVAQVVTGIGFIGAGVILQVPWLNQRINLRSHDFCGLGCWHHYRRRHVYRRFDDHTTYHCGAGVSAKGRARLRAAPPVVSLSAEDNRYAAGFGWPVRFTRKRRPAYG